MKKSLIVLWSLTLLICILGIVMYAYCNRYSYDLSTKQWEGKNHYYIDHKTIRFDKWLNKVEIYIGTEGISTYFGTQKLDVNRLKFKWINLELYDEAYEMSAKGGTIENLKEEAKDEK